MHEGSVAAEGGRTDARKTQPRVWAIVLTHGGAERLTGDCIESLLASSYGNLGVLLVDNASRDGSTQRLRERFPGIGYLNTGGNFGYTGGNNRGIAWALEHGADYVMVLNNDTTLDADCVSRLVETAERTPQTGCVSPKILYHALPDHIWYGGGDLDRTKAIGTHRREMALDDPTEPPRTEDITFATGCCMLLPAPVVRSVGAFEESFFIYCEDAELSARLLKSGYRLLYQPAARMYHHEPPGRPDPTPFQIRLRDRNRRRLAALHLTMTERVAFLVWFYSSRLVRLAQYVLRGERDKARAIVAGAFLN